MNGYWVEPDVRDSVVEFVRSWAEKTSLAIDQLLQWLELSTGKYYEWCQRYGLVNQHNGKVPRGLWLKDVEKQAILDYQELYPQGCKKDCVNVVLEENEGERNEIRREKV